MVAALKYTATTLGNNAKLCYVTLDFANTYRACVLSVINCMLFSRDRILDNRLR